LRSASHQPRFSIGAHDGLIAIPPESEPSMDQNLRIVLKEILGVVAATFFAVALLAFVTIPFNLGRHPGETQVPPIAQAPLVA
jgi:hypothetical protein